MSDVSVVLPAPDGPTTATSWPGSMAKLTLRSTGAAWASASDTPLPDEPGVSNPGTISSSDRG